MAATPIGNLSDASARLIEHLTYAKYIAAEDTRNLLKLAQGLNIKFSAKLYSLHEHNESDRISEILRIAETEDVLVVSDGYLGDQHGGILVVRVALHVAGLGGSASHEALQGPGHALRRGALVRALARESRAERALRPGGHGGAVARAAAGADSPGADAGLVCHRRPIGFLHPARRLSVLLGASRAASALAVEARAQDPPRDPAHHRDQR